MMEKERKGKSDMSMDFGNLTAKNGGKLTFNYFDTNKDGKISENEFEHVQRLYDVKASFDTFDKDGNGTIEGSEFKMIADIKNAAIMTDEQIKMEILRADLRKIYNEKIADIETAHPGRENDQIRKEIKGELDVWYNTWVNNADNLAAEDVVNVFKAELNTQAYVTCTKFETVHDTFNKAQNFVNEVLDNYRFPENYKDAACNGLYAIILAKAEEAIDKDGGKTDVVKLLADALKPYAVSETDASDDLEDLVKANLKEIADKEFDFSNIKNNIDELTEKLEQYKDKPEYKELYDAIEAELNKAKTQYETVTNVVDEFFAKIELSKNGQINISFSNVVKEINNGNVSDLAKEIHSEYGLKLTQEELQNIFSGMTFKSVDEKTTFEKGTTKEINNVNVSDVAKEIHSEYGLKLTQEEVQNIFADMAFEPVKKAALSPKRMKVWPTDGGKFQPMEDLPPISISNYTGLSNVVTANINGVNKYIDNAQKLMDRFEYIEKLEKCSVTPDVVKELTAHTDTVVATNPVTREPIYAPTGTNALLQGFNSNIIMGRYKDTDEKTVNQTALANCKFACSAITAAQQVYNEISAKLEGYKAELLNPNTTADRINEIIAELVKLEEAIKTMETQLQVFRTNYDKIWETRPVQSVEEPEEVVVEQHPIQEVYDSNNKSLMDVINGCYSEYGTNTAAYVRKGNNLENALSDTKSKLYEEIDTIAENLKKNGYDTTNIDNAIKTFKSYYDAVFNMIKATADNSYQAGGWKGKLKEVAISYYDYSSNPPKKIDITIKYGHSRRFNGVGNDDKFINVTNNSENTVGVTYDRCQAGCVNMQNYSIFMNWSTILKNFLNFANIEL